MDDFTLGKMLLGKKSTAEQKTFAANPSTASIVEMIAVTASSGGEVVVRNADEDSDEVWENGEPGVDFIELGDDGDYDEEAYDNADELEDVDDGALDMTDGDGADIEDSGTESVAFTVDAYHAAAVAAAEEEAGQEDDPVPGEDASVTDELDDGDASDVEDPGDPSLDDAVPGEDAEVAELSDDEYTAADDNDPDESEEPLEGTEASDGSTVVETTVSVKEGDRVLVSIQDGRMTVIGVVGGGDEAAAEQSITQEAVDEAALMAQEAAQDAADAVTAAGNAQQKAEEADAAASAAQTAANNAQAAANQASQEAQEAAQKATDAQQKADLVETNMAGVAADVDSVKEDAAAIRNEMLTSGDIEAVKTEMSATYATKDALTTLSQETSASVAQVQNTMSQDYAKKTEVEGAIVDAKADLQTQITQNASEISSVAKSVEAVEVDVTENAAKIQEAQSAAAAAQATADAAKTDASQAATAASNAQAAADAAKGNADAAQAAADAAAAELETAKAKLAEVEDNANATAEDLAAAQEAVATAQKAADDAAADAASAKSAADTAQSTADTAKTNASKAQTAADNAQKAADEAKEDLSALDTRVTAAETSITQNSEAIALRATKTELTAAVNAIEVGGRNLLLGTSTGEGWTYHTSFDSVTREFTKSTANTTETYIYCNNLFDLEAGQVYTLSFQAKHNGHVSSMEAHFLPKTWQTTGIAYTAHAGMFSLTTEYTLQTVTFTPKDSAASLEDCQLRFDNNGTTQEGTEAVLYLKDIKLEKGNKATDWTPAPEDMATVSEMNAAIELKADSITSTVSKTYATQASLATTNENVTSARAAAVKAQATADSIVQLIISTDKSTTLRSSGDTITATANVFHKGRKLTSDEVAELGTVRWYINGTVMAEGMVYNDIQACTGTLRARLEA